MIRAQEEIKEIAGILAVWAQRVSVDHADITVRRVPLAGVVRRGRPVNRAQLERPVRLETLEPQENRVRPEMQESRENRGLRETLDPQENRVQLEMQDLQGTMVLREMQEPRASRVLQAT